MTNPPGVPGGSKYLPRRRAKRARQCGSLYVIQPKRGRIYAWGCGRTGLRIINFTAVKVSVV